MSHLGHCTFSVSTGDKFCGGCGAAQIPDKCQSCGFVFLQDQRFCPMDGQARYSSPGSLSQVVPPSTVQRETTPSSPLPPSTVQRETTPPSPLTTTPKKHFTILVIGQTGSGKSTFLNVLCNYFEKGATVRAPLMLIGTKFLPANHEQSNKNSEQALTGDNKLWTSSQTQKAVSYILKDARTGHTYEVVDTPGLSDTRGVDQDDINIQTITDYVATLESVNCIAIVANGTQSRLDACLLSMLKRFRANLPNSACSSVAVVLTHCRSRRGCNFNINNVQTHLLGPKVPLKEGNVFFFDNMTFSSDPRQWTESDIQDELQPSWNQSMERVEKFLEHVHSCPPISTADFGNMKRTREEIKSKMAEVQCLIGKADLVRQALSEFQEVDGLVNTRTNFMRTRFVQVAELVEIPHYATSCQVHQVTCHNECANKEATARGVEVCKCFQGGMGCSACLKQSSVPCKPLNHFYDTKKWIHKDVTLESVMDELKERYGDHRSSQTRDVEMLSAFTDQLLKEIKSLCNRLAQVCDGSYLALEVASLQGLWEAQLAVTKNAATRRELQNRIDQVFWFQLVEPVPETMSEIELKAFIKQKGGLVEKCADKAEMVKLAQDLMNPPPVAPEIFSLREILIRKKDLKLIEFGMDPSKLEEHLSDIDFAKVFAMSRSQFAALEPAKKHDLKKAAGLAPHDPLLLMIPLSDPYDGDTQPDPYFSGSDSLKALENAHSLVVYSLFQKIPVASRASGKAIELFLWEAPEADSASPLPHDATKQRWKELEGTALKTENKAAAIVAGLTSLLTLLPLLVRKIVTGEASSSEVMKEFAGHCGNEVWRALNQGGASGLRTYLNLILGKLYAHTFVGTIAKESVIAVFQFMTGDIRAKKVLETIVPSVAIGCSAVMFSLARWVPALQGLVHKFGIPLYGQWIAKFADQVPEIIAKVCQFLTAKAGISSTLLGVALLMASQTKNAVMLIAMLGAEASTGRAIITLSGAAARNAALAWLGGGTIANGGGGMAAGAAILSLASTVGMILTSIGILTLVYQGYSYATAPSNAADVVKQETGVSVAMDPEPSDHKFETMWDKDLAFILRAKTWQTALRELYSRHPPADGNVIFKSELDASNKKPALNRAIMHYNPDEVKYDENAAIEIVFREAVVKILAKWLEKS